MAQRKSVRALSDSEKTALIDAIWALKRERSSFDGLSTYDRYVVWHQRAANQQSPWNGDSPAQPTGRNAAHRGPAFLPWHREYLRRFELDLQRVSGNPDLGLPYWDWEIDGQQPADQQPLQPVWDLVGGDGTPTNINGQTFFIVADGPFGFDTARLSDPTIFDDPNVWLTVNPFGQRSSVLMRAMGQNPDALTLPTKDHVDTANLIESYDLSPWNEASAATQSFRNVLEGFRGHPDDEIGLHNRIHVWVGGSMGPATSPNDPVFFLHHSNVDRIWAQWQDDHPVAQLLPEGDGPFGHNTMDPLYPWDGQTTPELVSMAGAAELGDVEYVPAAIA